jgi:hypothetical protein
MKPKLGLEMRPVGTQEVRGGRGLATRGAALDSRKSVPLLLISAA